MQEIGYSDRSFLVNGPAVWNSLPVVLRSPDTSLDTFKDKLKTFPLQNCLLNAYLQPWRIFSRYKLPYYYYNEHLYLIFTYMNKLGNLSIHENTLNRSQIFRLKWTKSTLGWGSAPHPTQLRSPNKSQLGEWSRLPLFPSMLSVSRYWAVAFFGKMQNPPSNDTKFLMLMIINRQQTLGRID